MKKKYLLMIIATLILMYAPSVLAADITGCSSVLPNARIDIKIVNVVHTIVVVIKIVVPILLVVFGMLDLLKAITAQKEDEIKKGQQIFVKRLITAAIIFFVIQIVQLLVSFASGNNENSENIMNCASCFINGANDDGTCK